MGIHTLDKQKVREELFRKGWRIDSYGAWVRPKGLTHAQAETDWMESIICAIQCKHEDIRIETIRLQQEERKQKYKGHFDTDKGGAIDIPRV